jgi:hypothetical protein
MAFSLLALFNPSYIHTLCLSDLSWQVHTTDETKALFAGAGSGALSCDGIADVYVKDFATYREAFKDPHYVEKIAPDEARFLNREKTLVTLGYDYVVIEDGKLVGTHERSY